MAKMDCIEVFATVASTTRAAGPTLLYWSKIGPRRSTWVYADSARSRHIRMIKSVRFRISARGPSGRDFNRLYVWLGELKAPSLLHLEDVHVVQRDRPVA